MNKSAQALGRMGKGKKKTLTDEQRAAQAERMRAVALARVAVEKETGGEQ